MKNKRITFLLSFCLPLAIAWGEIPPAKTVFTQYMNQAQTFANNYPREKAYLHFDNTSYYVGVFGDKLSKTFNGITMS